MALRLGHAPGNVPSVVRVHVRATGVEDVVMWRSLDRMKDASLNNYSGIYIGGGNTYRLLATVRKADAVGRLARYAESGGVVYGGSAGVLLPGSDISTARRMDPNDVRLQDTTTGLDLALGHAIWCHYRSAERPVVEEWSQVTGRPVLALSERTGVVREDDGLRVVGFDPVLRVAGQTTEEFRVGDLIPA